MPTKDTEWPWTIEANILNQSDKDFDNSTIDLVITRYLMSGDVRPLAWWLQEGHVPGSDLLNYISAMLSPGNASTKNLPFELNTKSRTAKRGRPPKGPEEKIRDMLTFLQVEAIMERGGRGSYDSALKEVAELQGLELPTIKRAYDSIHKVTSQSKSQD